MKKFLMNHEVVNEYGIKDDYLRALCKLYGVEPCKASENLYVRDELEAALLRHRDDGCPNLKRMRALTAGDDVTRLENKNC